MPPTELKDIELDEISLVDKGDDPEAKVALFKRDKTKAVDGKNLSASWFAYVPDPNKPSTWKLPIHDARQVDAAVATLGAGFRKRKVQIPQEDLTKVKARVRTVWRKFHTGDEEMPAAIKRGPLEVLEATLKAEGDAQSFEEVLDENETRRELFEAMDKIWSMFNALQGSVESIMSDDEVTDKREAIRASLNQFSDAMREAVPTVKVDPTTGVDDMKQLEELQKKLDEEVAARETAEAELEKLRAADKGDEDVTKGLSEEARKLFEEQAAKMAAQDEELKKLKEAREDDTVRKHLKEVADGVPNTDDADLRKAYRALDEKAREALDKVLRGAKEAYALLGKEKGGGGDGGDKSAYEEATSKAQELMEKHPETYKTLERARAQVWKVHPDLRQRYSKERDQAH